MYNTLGAVDASEQIDVPLCKENGNPMEIKQKD
jgi:hypothetical protein